MRFPDTLVDQIVRSNVTLFLGDGVASTAGLPGRADLLMPLAAEAGAPPRAGLLDIAQLYESKFGRQALLQKIIDATDTTNFDLANAAFLAPLTQLPVKTWLTTHYDDLFERILRQARRSFQLVVRDQDLPYASAEQLTLVKLHGDRTQPVSLIVTQSDFNNYFRRYELVKKQLASLLVTTTFLFVGYEADDPALNQLQAEIGYDLQQHGRWAYALMFEADELTRSNLAASKIQVVTIEEGADLSRRQLLLKERLEADLAPLKGRSDGLQSENAELRSRVDRLRDNVDRMKTLRDELMSNLSNLKGEPDDE